MSITVSVVIPAYNAACTIAETLRSASAQSLPDIELVVIDDGSTDGTAAIVADMAQREPRLRLIRQPNGGVARARNRGLAEARGRFIAPLDADDVWHPEKLARQVAALERAGPGAALAYNWFRRIDMQGAVMPGSPRPQIEGWVYHRHLTWNFISNGSTPLIRAEALRTVHYEPALRDAGNQGCEDYLLQLRLARQFTMVCVPAFLTGYRRAVGAMSNDVARMLRSHLHTFDLIAATAPPSAMDLIRREIARYRLELARNQLRSRDLPSAAIEMFRGFRSQPLEAVVTAWREFDRAASRQPRGDTPARGRSFASYRGDEIDGPWATKRSARLLGDLAVRDARYGEEREQRRHSPAVSR